MTKISTTVSHTAADMTLWTGRAELFETARARYWYQLAKPYEDQNIGLIGFACDQGVRRNQGRVGARAAPPLIRQAFATLPVIASVQTRYDNQLATLLGDAGDIHCHDDDDFAAHTLEQAQLKYADKVGAIVKQGGLPIGLGGGHAIAYGSFLGLWQALSSETDQPTHDVSNVKNYFENDVESNLESHVKSHASTMHTIGVINFDAHLDIRQSDVATSGTPFRQIAEHLEAQGQPFHYCCIGVSRFSNTAALFDRAEQLGVHIISDEDCTNKKWKKIAAQIEEFINDVDVVYLTIDMDCLPSSVVPGVSAPAAYGIELSFVERAVKRIMASNKVKMADIAEINPSFDIDGRSCKVAARLLATIIEQHLLLV
ncbi:formimidoylglutamase [Psychrobacter okhotskensis]|uniref:formimidoylglutamase n=1 Tax=Psychrobacter okhotskensis TaxID=212403 RepID=UPI003B836625